jgi:hypothetical protein
MGGAGEGLRRARRGCWAIAAGEAAAAETTTASEPAAEAPASGRRGKHTQQSNRTERRDDSDVLGHDSSTLLDLSESTEAIQRAGLKNAAARRIEFLRMAASPRY